MAAAEMYTTAVSGAEARYHSSFGRFGSMTELRDIGLINRKALSNFQTSAPMFDFELSVGTPPNTFSFYARASDSFGFASYYVDQRFKIQVIQATLKR